MTQGSKAARRDTFFVTQGSKAARRKALKVKLMIRIYDKKKPDTMPVDIIPMSHIIPPGMIKTLQSFIASLNRYLEYTRHVVLENCNTSLAHIPLMYFTVLDNVENCGMDFMIMADIIPVPVKTMNLVARTPVGKKIRPEGIYIKDVIDEIIDCYFMTSAKVPLKSPSCVTSRASSIYSQGSSVSSLDSAFDSSDAIMTLYDDEFDLPYIPGLSVKNL